MAKFSRKLSDSIHALGERHPYLSTVCKKTLPPTPASLKVKKIAGIVSLVQGCPIKISRSVLVSDKQTPVSKGLRLSTVLEILMGQP